MKNRNDDKKYILNQYRKIQIKRLFNRLQEIQKRHPRNNQTLIKRMFGESQNKLSHIPRNHNEQRLYQIRKENERLVQKLSTTKMTVISHRQPLSTPQKNRKYQLRSTIRQKQIQNQNKRLFRAIKRVSSEVFHRTHSNSFPKFNRLR